jgi:subtilisin family serine protease
MVQPADEKQDLLIRTLQARTTFKVDGEGVAVVVIDSGINFSHPDFKDIDPAGTPSDKNRVITHQSFLEPDEPQTVTSLTTDDGGHGSNVAGIIGAAYGSRRTGIAPRVQIHSLKVFGKAEGGGFDPVLDSLKWVIAKKTSEFKNIVAVCMSLGDDSNGQRPPVAGIQRQIDEAISQLYDLGVAVCVATGNDYYKWQSEGMSFPATCKKAISVGACFDMAGLSLRWMSGAEVYDSIVDTLTPFSQRLSRDAGAKIWTTVISPGSQVVSTGLSSSPGTRGFESIMDGTSQATPAVVGVVALLQQYHFNRTGQYAPTDKVVASLKNGIRLVDSANDSDNVRHTGRAFVRVDAVSALQAMSRFIEVVDPVVRPPPAAGRAAAISMEAVAGSEKSECEEPLEGAVPLPADWFGCSYACTWRKKKSQGH